MTDMTIESRREVEQLPFNTEDYSLKEILKPQYSALLVVDMQNDFLDPKGFFAQRLKTPIEQMQSTIPHIQGLIETARKAHVPVIFTKGYEDVKFRKGPDIRRAVKWDERDGDGSVNAQSGTWGADFYEGIEPQEGEVVIEKHKWSAFDGIDKEGKSLQKILEGMGVKTLVVTGVVAETCIETSIRDAYQHGYFVVIPRNSIGSNDPEQLNARMKYWDRGFVGDVVTEDVVKENWPAKVKMPQPSQGSD